MTCYLFYAKESEYSENEIHFLKNSSEAEKLLKTRFFRISGFKYRSISNLAELIFFETPKDEFYFCPIEDFIDCCKETFDNLCLKYGEEVIHKTFPNDKFDIKTKNDLRIMIDKYFGEVSDAWEKQTNHENAIREGDRFDGWVDELNRDLDKDDNGFWRISNES